jgi:uncharacterized protein (TIGR02466 family)
MNIGISNIFPTPIYYSLDTFSENIDELEKKILSLKDNNDTVRTSTLNVDSSHLTVPNLNKLGHPFNIFADEIERHLLLFTKRLGISPKLKISNMWFNISDRGDFNFPHSHPGSIISGVFYVKSNGNSDLRFYNNHYLVSNFISSDDDKVNEMSYYIWDIPCARGKLLMWPSHIIHGNPMQTEEGQKIAVSFNTVIDTESL